MKRSRKRRKVLASLDDRSLPLFVREDFAELRRTLGKLARQLESLDGSLSVLEERWKAFLLSRPTRREDPPRD